MGEQFAAVWLLLAFLLVHRFDIAYPDRGSLRSIRFYAFAVPALAAAGFGVAWWKHLFVQPVGFPGRAVKYLIHPVVDDALIVTTLLLGIVCAFAYFSKFKKEPFNHAQPMLAIAAYVVTAAVAGYCRYRFFLTI
ncbi:MAG: hypothetical protein HY897_10790 [Deltaproteobacteria bacterium]|nr:hypothetical protein [Deltaproteobacteria bacterium]